MTTQTEAQRLADVLDAFVIDRASNNKAAAELRRLEEVSEYFQSAYGQELITSNELRRANAELLEALTGCISEAGTVGSDGWMTGEMHSDAFHTAIAAIVKHENKE